LQVLKGHSNHIWQAQFTPNDATVISRSHDGSMRLWHMVNQQTKKELKSLTLPEIMFLIYAAKNIFNTQTTSLQDGKAMLELYNRSPIGMQKIIEAYLTPKARFLLFKERFASKLLKK